jgi:fatty acid kinase fatty acid binding subunit
MNVALVTDSTADLPADLTDKYQIHVVPNLVIIDGQTLVDGKDISRDEFYQRLPGMKDPPTTSTASSGEYQQLYQDLLEFGADQVLSVHVSSQLSGIYNAAHTAAQEFPGRVHVQDSQSVSMGLGFQVLAAAEAIAHQASISEVLSLLTEVRSRVRVVAMLDTLEYVRRSGRVSWARARLGGLLQVKPFVEVREGGKVISLGETRTRSKGITRLKELMLGMGELERLAILHTRAEADARQILNDLKNLLPFEPLIVNVTTVIGTHVGPNGLGFAAVVK